MNQCADIIGEPLRVRRLAVHAAISPNMDARMGGNINGPSAIRVPDWVDAPLGSYYLYFADHCGSYIRLAYADDPDGPWQTHEPGCLDMADSLFCTEPANPEVPPPYWTGSGDGWRQFLYPHVASPDVHIHEASREIRMYFHGLRADGEQLTRLAVSRDGLHFEVREPLLAPCYLRAFEHAGSWYGLASPNWLMRSPDGIQPFEYGSRLLPENTRHCAVFAEDDRLIVLWTEIGDSPERIYAGGVSLCEDWRDWRLEQRIELLRPELDWEGASEVLGVSRPGASDERVNELRDPFLFRDGERLLLYYVGGGECGIGIAEVEGLLAA